LIWNLLLLKLNILLTKSKGSNIFKANINVYIRYNIGSILKDSLKLLSVLNNRLKLKLSLLTNQYRLKKNG